jgi:hypothetical protein
MSPAGYMVSHPIWVGKDLLVLLNHSVIAHSRIVYYGIGYSGIGYSGIGFSGMGYSGIGYFVNDQGTKPEGLIMWTLLQSLK